MRIEYRARLTRNQTGKVRDTSHSSFTYYWKGSPRLWTTTTVGVHLWDGATRTSYH